MEQRISSAKDQARDVSDLEMKTRANGLSAGDKDSGLPGQWKSSAGQQILKLLSSQLEAGNSKMVFMFAMSP